MEGEVNNLPRLRGREKSSGECGVCHWECIGRHGGYGDLSDLPPPQGLSDLSSGEVAKLPCSHSSQPRPEGCANSEQELEPLRFHIPCIKKWLTHPDLQFVLKVEVSVSV